MANAFPLDQTLPAGTLVAIPLSYYSLTYITRLKEGDIVFACADTGNFSASSFSYDLSTAVNALGQSGVLYGVITAEDDGNDIIQQVKAALNSFKTVVGLNVSEIDAATTTTKPGFDLCKSLPFLCNLGSGIQSTVIIILIALVLIVFFLSQSKNIKIGI